LSKSDSRKEEVNLKLQEQLFQASAKDQEKRKIQKPIVQKKTQLKELNNININDIENETDKSRIAEKLMEMSIVTKSRLDESALNSVQKSGMDFDRNISLFKKKPKKRGKGDKKIEDKLIEYGEVVKKKKKQNKKYRK